MMYSLSLINGPVKFIFLVIGSAADLVLVTTVPRVEEEAEVGVATLDKVEVTIVAVKEEVS